MELESIFLANENHIYVSLKCYKIYLMNLMFRMRTVCMLQMNDCDDRQDKGSDRGMK